MISPIMPTNARADLPPFVRGEGCYLFSSDGKSWLDFASGIAVNALGHCHPHLVKALTDQAGKLWHISNMYRIPLGEQLAQRLVDHSFADTVFFTNSGTEAWECGAKLCRKYMSAQGTPEKWRIITCRGGFHGRTIAAIASLKSEKMVKGFGPMPDGFDQIPFNDLAAAERAITFETAAICVEPIQGEGGILPADLDYLRGLRELADRHGILLFFDEIQCGYGRSGKFFAHEWAGITPDVMCLAKGIGSGFPLGACLATEEAAKGMTAGSHGTTYGGNPLAMAVGNAVLDIILADGFLAQTDRIARHLWKELVSWARRYPQIISEIRGAGLMLGIKFHPHITNTDILKRLRAGGLLCAQAGDNVVRLLPPLIIAEKEVAQALSILDDVVGSTAQDVSDEQKLSVSG